MMGFRRIVAIAVACSVMSIPTAASAQSKDQFRDESKASAAQLRALGEPKDRCSTGAYVGQSGVITRTFAATPLSVGDRILSIGQTDLSSKGPDEIIALLRATAPDAVVSIKVLRQGQPVELQLTCSNARPAMEALLIGLDQAAGGKFDECVTTFGQRNDFGLYGALVKTQCASYSKKSKRYDLGQLSYDAMKMMIEDAHWAPGMREEVVGRMRATEGLITQSLGSNRYDELVSLSRRWPGGEQVYDASAPDWGLFRRKAEASLRGRLVDPDSARIEWPFGFTYGTWKPVLAKRLEGYWTCGLINARNRMGGYTGATSFVVVLDRAGNVQYADMGSGRDFDFVSSQCGNSVKFLPAAPPEFAAATMSTTPTSPASIADELKKLVELKDSGALSEAEFQAAKQKLLGTTDQRP